LALRAIGRLDDAVAHFAQATKLDPSFAAAYGNLGDVLREHGKLEEAVSMYQRALALRPESVEARHGLGIALHRQAKLDEAVAEYQHVLTIKPDYSDAQNSLGLAFREQGKFSEAVAQFRRVLALKPSIAEVHYNLGNALMEQGKLAEAAACYERALALRPDFLEAYCNLGNALKEQGKLDAAVGRYRQALAVNPRYADAYKNLGSALRDLGRLEEARRVYEKAIELAPNRPIFYLSYATSKRFAPGDVHLAAIEKLASESSLADEDRMYLHFALGKAYGDLEDHERSFRHPLVGNALKRQQIAYDEAAARNMFGRIAEIFTPELMRDKKNLGDPSPVPVFIVGMLRSGTTLIEQILASHPKVFGAGELALFGDTVARLLRPNGGSALGLFSSMGGKQLRELGASYVAAIRGLAPNAERITDKMPLNFRFAGLIHLALPHARIIHARRDPIDTCLSCFSKLFAADQPYSYDLAELGRFYRYYEALMEHWRRVLPPGVMLEVQYEDVVADLDCQAHRIVAHCGLQWDDACLAFHKAERPVRTASTVQVRQPIYRTSVRRWHAYKHLLGPLIKALGV
jgi:tetratricopeptide (TPR) repeat protein